MIIGDIEARSGRKGSSSTPALSPPPDKSESGHGGSAVCCFGRAGCDKVVGGGGGSGGDVGGGDRRYPGQECNLEVRWANALQPPHRYIQCTATDGRKQPHDFMVQNY